DTIDQAAVLADLPERPSVTRDLRVHGYDPRSEVFGDLGYYGSDAAAVEALSRERPEYAERLHERYSLRVAQVVWAARHEMARTVEDVLARRTRYLLLDARASVAMAPRVAAVLAQELGRDAAWEREQVESYTALARGYLVPDSFAGAS
ncbi:MAG TPA: glycerol-3-phosphate dehydrogenase C-terminal domain-containing protein, partial [Planctomycetaceae bacterium]